MAKSNPLYDAGFKDGSWSQHKITETRIALLEQSLGEIEEMNVTEGDRMAEIARKALND